ncbi:Protein pellino [Halotydeus destructor]|nr:Protein pellino [Halotydeus destructor]
MHPQNMNGTTGDCRPKAGIWREVSVGGDVYSIRETRSASQKGIRIADECNILQDGTLIDLCGATLMWRSADGLLQSPTKRMLDDMVDELNAGRPLCPVGLNTLVIPRKTAVNITETMATGTQPYVYLKCGHVQGSHDWGQNKNSNSKTCPMCLNAGPVAKLSMGLEPSFYFDCLKPTYCFNPCGHMASEATVRFWTSIAIPHGTDGFQAMCPFCANPIQIEHGFVRLIFQDHVDC